MTKGGRYLLPVLIVAFLLGATDLTIADQAVKHDEDLECGAEPSKPKKLAKAITKRYKPASMANVAKARAKVRAETLKGCEPLVRKPDTVSKPAAQPAARADPPTQPGPRIGSPAERVSPPVAADSDKRDAGFRGIQQTSAIAPVAWMPGGWLGPTILVWSGPPPGHQPAWSQPVPIIPAPANRPFNPDDSLAWDKPIPARVVPLPGTAALLLLTFPFLWRHYHGKHRTPGRQRPLQLL